MINNKNKILALAIIIFILLNGLSLLNAKEVTVADEKFNIPDGFNEDTNKSKFVRDSTGTLEVKVYSNVYTDMIAINVLTPDDGRLLLPENQPGFVNKTIKGITGIYNEDSNEFQYISDKKMVSVSAHNQTLLEEVLVDNTTNIGQ